MRTHLVFPASKSSLEITLKSINSITPKEVVQCLDFLRMGFNLASITYWLCDCWQVL